jgi:hypothetical protein
MIREDGIGLLSLFGHGRDALAGLILFGRQTQAFSLGYYMTGFQP